MTFDRYARKFAVWKEEQEKKPRKPGHKPWSLEDFYKAKSPAEDSGGSPPPQEAAGGLDIGSLPPFSWAFQFRFELQKPVVTKDEERMYRTDNPVRRERASGVPAIAGSSWKGALRAAFHQLQREYPNHFLKDDLKLLFGSWYRTGPSEDKDFFRGRLECYTTRFFGSTPGEYITQSLDRGTKIGKNPVTYETIPARAQGDFTLLYCTYADGFLASHKTSQESEKHRRLIATAVPVMLRQTGVGGKTSSGFGTARDKLISPGRCLRREGAPEEFQSLTDLHQRYGVQLA